MVTTPARYHRWLEVVLPMYSMAVVLVYLCPQYLPMRTDMSTRESFMPLAVWGVVGAMGGVLTLSGLIVAFFLLYSPVYLMGRSWMLFDKGGWVDHREFRFYAACFILLCFLGGLAILHPVAAASTFVLLAGSAHLLWRALA
jgi:hypothetical protein